MSIGGEGYGERDRTGEDGLVHGRPSARLGTRTRLPGEEGGGRPPKGPGRSLVTVVGVVVLLIAAIAFANRSGGSGDDTSSDAHPGAGAGAGQPTAPTGQHPVKGTKDGIPSGFPHTEQGAQSAAANYAVALGGDGMFVPSERHKIVSTVYAPAVAAKRARDLDKAYSNPKFLKNIGLDSDGSAPKGTTFVSRTNPAGTKIEDFSKSRAKVSVWYSSLFGIAGEGSKNPVTESWYTNEFELKWVDGDWKVTDFQQKNGPAPVGHDQAAASAKEMSDAVKGYGGFTYAR